MEAAESKLEGDVRAASAGGAIRYRIWPARRRPLFAVLAFAIVLVVTAGTWYGFDSVFYAILMFVGSSCGVALAFFPTEVALDGHQLNMKQLGTPRTWDLRRFRRLEVLGEPLPRIELRKRAKLNPVDSVRSVSLPLPWSAPEREAVVQHVRRWVGRQVTGRFELDDDHVPEDTVEVEG